MGAASGTSASEDVSCGGYHYWHDSVPKGAPPPEPQKLASEKVEVSLPEVTIENYAFMDDEDVRIMLARPPCHPLPLPISLL